MKEKNIDEYSSYNLQFDPNIIEEFRNKIDKFIFAIETPNIMEEFGNKYICEPTLFAMIRAFEVIPVKDLFVKFNESDLKAMIETVPLDGKYQEVIFYTKLNTYVNTHVSIGLKYFETLGVCKSQGLSMNNHEIPGHLWNDIGKYLVCDLHKSFYKILDSIGFDFKTFKKETTCEPVAIGEICHTDYFLTDDNLDIE